MVITPLEILLLMGTGMIFGAAIDYKRERTGAAHVLAGDKHEPGAV